MNILILCTSSGLGGLELYVEREFRFLSSRGHNCFVALGHKSKLVDHLQAEQEQLLFLARHGHHLPLFASMKLANFIDKYKIDVMHMHWGKDLNLASMAKRLSRTKPSLIYSRHMGITRSKKDIVHRFFYSQVSHVLVISKQVLKEAHKFLPLKKEQCSLLYHGVPEPGKEIECCEQTLNENIMQYSFRIAMFGRIEHGKGQHLLVEAINVLVKDNVDVGVTVVGHSMDDSYYASLKVDIAHYGLEDRFEFIPFIDRPMRVMPCFDVVVLLTYCETFGLVLVEAMRAGVAVIGTDAGGVPEIIKNNDTGLLVPPGNVAALVEALRKLVNNERFKNELAINGKKWADRKFNEEQHFNKLEVILESQLSQK